MEKEHQKKEEKRNEKDLRRDVEAKKRKERLGYCPIRVHKSVAIGSIEALDRGYIDRSIVMASAAAVHLLHYIFFNKNCQAINQF